MLFDSNKFVVFFAVFFILYHALSRNFRWQNALALVASCYFYGSWDPRFLALLFVSAGIDYFAGLALATERPAAQRKRVLAVSMVANLGILFAFKYFNFFAGSLMTLLAKSGVHASLPVLNVALPVGISFYTFQSMSYTIDIYRRELEPERNPITYFAFVSFFPHMVAGPIQRARHLIGQLNRPRVVTFEHVREAVWLLTWGYFIKCVISDGAAPFADMAFQPAQKSGWTSILGTIAFGIQIYCDFNAYSLIARGTGRLLGIEFIWNFNQPYFSTSMQDFWRRWHISLSTWLRDYLYITLGGNRRGRARTYVNLMTTMLLGGLWHGAAWNFVFWGALHGGALATERAYQTFRRGKWGALPAPIGWSMTMVVVFFGWFLFRCRFVGMIKGMLLSLRHLQWEPQHSRIASSLVALILPLAIVEIWQAYKKDLLAPLTLSPLPYAVVCGVLSALALTMFNRFSYAFIYFQF